MMKLRIVLTFILIPVSFLGLTAQEAQLVNYASSILQRDLQRHVEVLASDSLQGREAGMPGGWMAGDYIAACFRAYGLQAPFEGSYFQEFDTTLQARNVIGVIRGAEEQQGAVVVGAHYDHHGMHNYGVYNGADDNASGVAALLETAKALSAMQRNGYSPKRTIIFIAYDAKERSMAGSEWYVKYPVIPLKNTKVCINMDMLGRIDAPPAGDTNYVLVVGADKHKQNFRPAVDYENRSRNLHFDIDYSFYGSAAFSEMFYQMSDQYSFGKHKIPVLYFTSGMHDDLWKSGDDAHRLSYPVLQKRTQLIFYTTWNVAN